MKLSLHNAEDALIRAQCWAPRGSALQREAGVALARVGSAIRRINRTIERAEREGRRNVA